MKKLSMLTLIMVFLLATAPFAVQARGENSGRDPSKPEDSSEIENEVEVEDESEHMTSDDVLRSDLIKVKRQEVKERVEAKKAEIAEKLSGKRAERCEKQSSRINSILDNRGNSYKRHLEVFNAIRDRLVDFVANKNLSTADTAALEEAMNTAQVNAVAALDTLNATDFVCGEVSASNPGSTVRDLAAETKQALKDYRTAIKNYAKVVKAQAEATETNDDQGGAQ